MISDANEWAQIELRHLIALDAIGQTGSFGRAAVLIGYTQSAISQQIATLETLVGERLIERSRGQRRVALTEPGRLLLRHAEAIVAQLRAAQADVAAYRSGAIGRLRVGTYQSVGTHLLPDILRAFAAEWPQIEILLTEDPQDDRLLSLLAGGALDLTFTVVPVKSGPFAAIELLSDPWLLLAAQDSPLARQTGPVDLQTIIHYPFISYQRCRSTELLDAYLERQGIALRMIFRSDDNGTVRGLVAAGMGIAFVPRLALEADPRIVARELPATVPPRVIGLAWHRDRYQSPAARAFIDRAVECSRALAAARNDIALSA
jgi:DNA-binding transcriptional LysR family regulator